MIDRKPLFMNDCMSSWCWRKQACRCHGLCQQSSWYGTLGCRPASGVRRLHLHLCRNYLRTYCVHSFQISVLVCPRAEPVWKGTLFGEFFNFWLTLYPMEEKKSKRYSFLKSLLNLFKLFFWIFFWVFFLTKVLFRILEILRLWFF